jgi:hypothetical protein
MRPRTIREIRHRERAINGEGFGLSLVAREGAAEIRELAKQLCRLPPDPLWQIQRRYRRRPVRRSW